MKSANRPKSSGPSQARRTSAILALIAEPTIEGAALVSGVGRSTIFQWLQDEAFAGELTRARTRAFDSGLNVLKGATERAAAVLIDLLKSRNETTKRLSAVAILEIALKVHDGADLEARLLALERAVAGRPGAIDRARDCSP